MQNSQNRIHSFLQNFCTALRFLTIFPVSWRAKEDLHYFPTCLVWFPLIGALIGCVGSLGAYLLSLVFPVSVVAFLGVCYLAFISGCLHLDGLSDTWDGLLSSRPKEESLEIMKDSRVGAMGAVIIVLVLLGKFAALSSMNTSTLCHALFFIPICGRCAILLTMARLEYAREEGGLGRLFYTYRSKYSALIGFVALVLLFLVIAPERLLPALGLIFLTSSLFDSWCKRRLGGATGDTLGATCELVEMSTCLAFSLQITIF